MDGYCKHGCSTSDMAYCWQCDIDERQETIDHLEVKLGEAQAALAASLAREEEARASEQQAAALVEGAFREGVQVGECNINQAGFSIEKNRGALWTDSEAYIALNEINLRSRAAGGEVCRGCNGSKQICGYDYFEQCPDCNGTGTAPAGDSQASKEDGDGD